MTTENKPSVLAGRASSTATLVLVFSGETILSHPRRHAPGREPLVIGREVEGGLSLLDDPRASGRHASVHRSQTGGLRIVDEGGGDGTSVNGRRITEATLVEGDVVTVGSSLLVVSDEPRSLADAHLPELIGASVAARRLRGLLAQVAPTDAAVLLLGERGTGKEVAARAVHARSGRKGPFVPVHCGAIPEGELSGHMASAEGGTLFLDEVGELPAALQPGLLASRPRDVRTVAATSRDLRAAVDEQSFPGDLYARLAELPIRLPPLRDRRDDVLLLLAHALGPTPPRLEADLAERLLLHRWPRNVREVLAVAKQLRARGGDGPYGLELVEEHLWERGPGSGP